MKLKYLMGYEYSDDPESNREIVCNSWHDLPGWVKSFLPEDSHIHLTATIELERIKITSYEAVPYDACVLLAEYAGMVKHFGSKQFNFEFTEQDMKEKLEAAINAANAQVRKPGVSGETD